MIRPVPRSIMCSQRRLGHEEGAGEVDGQDLVPVLVGHLEDRLVDRDAGVVDEDVEAAVLVDHLAARCAGSRRPSRRCPGGCEPVSLVLGELGLEGLGALAVAAVAGGDGGALRGEAAADRGADAARAAGDEGDAARELRGRRPSNVVGFGAWWWPSLISLLWLSGPSARRATRRCRARSPCGPSSRPSGRCGRRAGRDA